MAKVQFRMEEEEVERLADILRDATEDVEDQDWVADVRVMEARFRHLLARAARRAASTSAA
jgi:hypothetical protein